MARTEMPSGFLGVLAVLRFLAELGLLFGLGWAGWAVGGSIVLSVVLAVLLPVAAAAVWGLWVAPRATRRLQDPARFALEVALFAACFLGLLAAGTPAALIFAAVLCVAYLASALVGRKGF